MPHGVSGMRDSRGVISFHVRQKKDPAVPGPF